MKEKKILFEKGEPIMMGDNSKKYYKSEIRLMVGPIGFYWNIPRIKGIEKVLFITLIAGEFMNRGDWENDNWFDFTWTDKQWKILQRMIK